MGNKTGHYRVDYEWAKLREVVLGGTAVTLPPPGTVFDKYINELYPDEDTREFLRSLRGTPLSEAHPEYHQRMVEETNALASIFERHGVVVHRAEPYSEETLRVLGDGGYCDGWAKDSFETVGPYFFELAHKKHLYRMFWTAARSQLRRAFEEDPKMRLISFPQPVPTHVNDGYGPGPFFEGGDVLVLPGNKVIIGESGQASDKFGEAIFKRFLESVGYELISVKLHPHMLHLDCCACLIGPDLIFYCPDAFPEGLPTELAKFPNKVETKLVEAQRLANNGVVINSTTVVLDQSLKDTYGKKIEAFGKTIEWIDFSAHAPLGGSMRCKTGVLSRYDD